PTGDPLDRVNQTNERNKEPVNPVIEVTEDGAVKREINRDGERVNVTKDKDGNTTTDQPNPFAGKTESKDPNVKTGPTVVDPFAGTKGSLKNTPGQEKNSTEQAFNGQTDGGTPLANLTVAQLKQYAEEKGIDLPE